MSILSLSRQQIRMITIAALLITVAALALALPSMVSAQTANLKTCGPGDLFGCSVVDVGTGAARHPRDIAVQIIRIAMGFLGLVAVAIILYGGFKWMTAAGNDEKVGEAKKLIGAGIVGLIIIIAAYSIVTFVLTNIISLVNTGANPPSGGLAPSNQ